VCVCVCVSLGHFWKVFIHKTSFCVYWLDTVVVVVDVVIAIVLPLTDAFL